MSENVSTAESQNNLVPVSSRKSRLKKRTRLEIILIIVVIILAILLIFFFLLTIILACANEKPIPGNASCSSAECIRSASSLLESMNQTVDPCEDFYQFACGNWGKNHPVKDADIVNNWFAELNNAMLREIKEHLKEPSVRSSEPNAVFQAKSLFRSCIDTERLEDLGLEPIVVILDNVSLPRQIPNSKTAVDWDIGTALALVQRVMSLDSLVQLGPDIDPSTKSLLINFSPPTETPQLIKTIVSDPEDLPKATRLSGREAVKARIQYMAGILQLMDSWIKDENDETTNVSAIATAAVKIMLFSAEVALSITDDKNGTTSNVMMTIPQFQDMLDLSIRKTKHKNKINWKNYMTVLLEGIDKPFDLRNDKVSIKDVHYFQRLAQLLADSQTETIQRYVWWQVVEMLGPHTNKAMRMLKNQLFEKYFGSLPRSSRSTLCVQRVKKLLPKAISYIMAKKEDIKSTVHKVREMLDDIRESFNALVNEEEWMDVETKKAAKEKADAVVSFVGYQDWLLKPGMLDQFYDKIYLEENNYLYSVLKLKSREVVEFLRELLSEESDSYKNDTWNSLDTLQANAFYVRQENTILIPAGILHFPFYGRGLESLNYGSIGSILGHELTHGFDSEGKDYDKEGTKDSWWNPEMLQAYEERADCFINQYSEFGSTEYKVDGELTLAENIADNGGIREAYRAYQRFKERHGPEPKLPGLEKFSHEQLLFLAFANMWCMAEGTKYEVLAAKDTHSPARYRVMGSLSNSPEFSKTWKCAVNKTMNPSSKCIIW